MPLILSGVNFFFWESIFPARAVPVVHALVIDLVTIAIVAFGVFYRRYRRSDLLLAIVALNVGLFCVGVLIVQQIHIGVAFGFGLFAILSIIRLRSEQIAPEESAYYFIGLVIGLVNGMQFRDQWLVYVLNAAVIVVMVLLDNKFVLPRATRQLVTLDVVHPDEQSLRADLEERLNAKVLHLIVRQVDYVRDVTQVDVRIKTRRTPSSLPPRGFTSADPARTGSRDSFTETDLVWPPQPQR